MVLPSPYLMAFELVVVILFSACLRDAWRKGGGLVWQLFAGVVFGLILEWATIQQLNAYHYGQFLLMLGQVPVVIGVGWGTIIYSVRIFSGATDLRSPARAVLEGILALNIDLAMDAIAIRLGMWDWGLGFEDQYFGVPYTNFWAWFWVLFSFSMSLQLLGRLPGRCGVWLAPPGAVVFGVLGVLSTNHIITTIPSGYLRNAVVFLVLGSAVLLLFRLRPRTWSSNPIAWEVPLGFHAYFLAAGLISGVILEPPFLLFASMVMSLVALYLHRASLHSWLSDLQFS